MEARSLAAMLTRASRRRIDEAEAAAREAAKPALQNLSDDLLLDVCKLLPQTNLGRLCATSQNLRRVASHGSLWTHLSFPKASAPKLTDRRLAALLARIDAKNHLVHISLVGCKQIDGTGLLPLNGSTVLRTIDLRRAYVKQNEYRFKPLAPSAVEILKPMLTRLETVRVNVLDTSNFTVPQHGQQVAACSHCRELVPAQVETSISTMTFGACGTCPRRACQTCRKAMYRNCSNCGSSTCYNCLELDDDGDYICMDCLEYGSDGEFGG